MMEAQLNIYHHFYSQTVAWGPNQLEVHVLLSDPMPLGDMTLGLPPTASLCSLGARAHCPREESWGGHTEGREGAGMGRQTGPGSHSHHLVAVSLSPSLSLSSYLHPHLQNGARAS